MKKLAPAGSTHEESRNVHSTGYICEMADTTYPFPQHIKDSRVMVFVDGENLAIRYASKLKLKNEPPLGHIEFERGVFVWTQVMNFRHHTTCDTIRRHYYTSVQGSEDTRDGIQDRLKRLGIEAPRVFQKHKVRGSKRVDISLAVEMLYHAQRGNYDVGVLVAGDEDYVPLVEAVKNEGCRLLLWFLDDGLSPILKNTADHYFDLERVLFDKNFSRDYGW